MRRPIEQRGRILAVALWALFIYASVFSDWLEPSGGALFAETVASSYLD